MGSVLTGLDRVLADGLAIPGRGRIGLLCNAHTISSCWQPTAEALARVPGLHVARIFSPQHGFTAEKQDNMVESADGIHPALGVPIVSLYGERREPAPEQLAGLDALVIDLQDIGTRVYTFVNTALLCLQRAAAASLPVIVLDRPNPIGGRREGPVLREGFTSFVGLLDVPLRHGLTLGELCRYGAARMNLPDETSGFLRVIELAGWEGRPYFDDTGLPWIAPSPNMPTLETAIVYPGQVALEGTNVSEGRGTTRPFELCGASYIDPAAVRCTLMAWGYLAPAAGPGRDADEPTSVPGGEATAALRTTTVVRGAAGTVLEGTLWREVAYEPTFHKDAGTLVRGFQLHVVDRALYRPVAATIALLSAIRHCHGDRFAWAQPPYEYEYDRPPVDLIYGTDAVRLAIDACIPAHDIVEDWTAPVRGFEDRVHPYLLYD